MEDHIHILFALDPTIALSSLVRDVKANSSKFINEKGFVRGKFYWQEGFGTFSCSRSQLDKVAKYVLNQEQHHAQRSFKAENWPPGLMSSTTNATYLTGSNSRRSEHSGDQPR